MRNATNICVTFIHCLPQLTSDKILRNGSFLNYFYYKLPLSIICGKRVPFQKRIIYLILVANIVYERMGNSCGKIKVFGIGARVTCNANLRLP